MKTFNFRAPLGRIHFALEMYNLGSALKGEDGDSTLEAVNALLKATNIYAKDQQLKSFCSRNPGA